MPVNLDYAKAAYTILQGGVVKNLPSLERRAGLKWHLFGNATAEGAVVDAVRRVNDHNNYEGYESEGLFTTPEESLREDYRIITNALVAFVENSTHIEVELPATAEASLEWFRQTQADQRSEPDSSLGPM